MEYHLPFPGFNGRTEVVFTSLEFHNYSISPEKGKRNYADVCFQQLRFNFIYHFQVCVGFLKPIMAAVTEWVTHFVIVRVEDSRLDRFTLFQPKSRLETAECCLDLASFIEVLQHVR